MTTSYCFFPIFHTLYRLDDAYEFVKVNELTCFGDRFVWKTSAPNFTSDLFKLKQA